MSACSLMKRKCTGCEVKTSGESAQVKYRNDSTCSHATQVIALQVSSAP
jgi:hypothetical protein